MTLLWSVIFFRKEAHLEFTTPRFDAGRPDENARRWQSKAAGLASPMLNRERNDGNDA